MIKRPMAKQRLIRFLVALTVATAFYLGNLLLQTGVGNSDIPAGADIAHAQGPLDFVARITKALAQGTVKIIVGLAVPGYEPEGELANTRAINAQRAAITRAQDQLLKALSSQNVTAIKQFEFIPYMAMELDAAALAALKISPTVTIVEEDILAAPTLSDTVPLIRAHYAHTLFYKGSGQAVAILDTGVDNDHAALSTKIVSEACYSTTSGNATSLCPGGAGSSTASNSGDNCLTSISGCDHGTHVAGIAAGVAPEADIIAIQVFSRFDDTAGNTACGDFPRSQTEFGNEGFCGDTPDSQTGI